MKKFWVFVCFLAIFLIAVAYSPSAKAIDIKCGVNGINTAIGCVPVFASDNGSGLVNFIIKWAIGLGSGIAFLLILYSGFMIMTSTGNPERIKAGQELLGSAISGILLMIFSLFLLNLIGVNILGIFA